MAIVLNPIVAPDKLSLINSNFNKIAEAINESLVWRNGTTTGETLFTRDLDMNGFDILNAGTVDVLDSNLRDDLASASNGKGDALLSVKQPYAGSIVRTQHDKNAEYISLKDFGAKGDGITDDTVAIQAAVNSGIRNIIVPAVLAGQSYRTTSPINVNRAVSFVGEGVETQAAIDTFQNLRGAGSWFHFDHPGIGFNIQRISSGFQGVEFHRLGTVRKHNVTSSTFVPTVYDYDFYVSDCADLKLIDICMLNPYKGLFVTNGNQGRVWIDRLYGQPLAIGIQLKLTYDSVRISNIHFWPYWSFHSTVWAYQKLNTIGLNTWRADGLFINNYFSIFHRIGWQVSGDVTNGTTFKALVSNMFIDNCAYGYLVDNTARGHTASINNINIQMDPAIVDTGAKPVFVLPDSCDIDIVNISVSLAKAEAINIFGPFNRVGIHNPKIYDWAKGGTTVAAIVCADVNSSIVVTGRKIFDLGGSNVIYAPVGRITADIVSGAFSGTTNGSGDVVVTHSGRMSANAIKIQIKSIASVNAVVIASTATNFTVRIFNTSTGAALTGTAISFDWQAGMA